MCIRSAGLLLALTVVTVSATGQVVVRPQQQNWTPPLGDVAPARTGSPQSVSPAGYVGQSNSDARHVRYVAPGESESESVKTQQQPEVASSVAAATSKPAAFLDLTNEGLDAATASVVEPTHTDMLIRLGTWTVIILCLCGLTALAIRRWQTKHGMLPVARGQSQIVETVSLGANRSVSLVELRGVQALVGCDASGIQSIVPVPQAFPDILDHGDAEATMLQSSNAHIESTV